MFFFFLSLSALNSFLEAILSEHLWRWRQNVHDGDCLSKWGWLFTVEDWEWCRWLIFTSMSFVLDRTQRVVRTFRSFQCAEWWISEHIFVDVSQVMSFWCLCGGWNREDIHVQAFSGGWERFLVFIDEGIEINEVVFHRQRGHAVTTARANGTRSRTWRWTVGSEKRGVFWWMKMISVN